MTEIHELLQQLGITANYRGFYPTSLALALAAQDPRRLEAVTKDIYYAVAAQTGDQWKTVERNIRTAVRRAWAVNPDLLQRMAGYPMFGPPTVSEFLAIAASWLRTGAHSSVLP